MSKCGLNWLNLVYRVTSKLLIKASFTACQLECNGLPCLHPSWLRPYEAVFPLQHITHTQPSICPSVLSVEHLAFNLSKYVKSLNSCHSALTLTSQSVASLMALLTGNPNVPPLHTFQWVQNSAIKFQASDVWFCWWKWQMLLSRSFSWALHWFAENTVSSYRSSS